MSAGFYDLSGFPVQRTDSSSVLTGSEYANQAAATAQGLAAQAAAIPVPPSAGSYAAGMMIPVAQNYQSMFDQAGFNFGPNGLTNIQNALSNDFQNGSPEQAYASVGGRDNWNSWNSYYNGGQAQAQGDYNSQIAALDQAGAAQSAAAEVAAQARRQNQLMQQNAYSSQLGGGAAGGLLSHWNGLAGGSPTSTVQPGQNAPTSASVWGGGGIMGGGGATNLGMGSGTATAPSTGLNPFSPQMAPNNGMSTGTPMPMQAPPQAPNNGNAASWGGPFSAKNPWSFG